MSESSKSVSVPISSGKEDDLELFWSWFEDYANMKEFVDALDWASVDPSLLTKDIQ